MNINFALSLTKKGTALLFCFRFKHSLCIHFKHSQNEFCFSSLIKDQHQRRERQTNND